MLLFAQNLTVAGTLYHFIFREIISTDAEKFFVTVQNEQGPVTSFEMKRSDGRWLLVPPYPEWIKHWSRRWNNSLKKRCSDTKLALDSIWRHAFVQRKESGNRACR